MDGAGANPNSERRKKTGVNRNKLKDQQYETGDHLTNASVIRAHLRATK